MKQYMIHGINDYKHQAQEYEMAQLLDRVGHKWPAEGMPARMVRGIEVPKPGEINVAMIEIKVWVTPQRSSNSREMSRSTHRVKCECPGCGKEFSAGRLGQHLCKGA